MSENQQLDSGSAAMEAAPVMPVSASAGAQLRAAREAAGLHIAALAVSMKVPVKKLEALEADRWDLLPDAVFVRALASAVCRTLKIDSAPVMRQLPQVATPRLAAEDQGINTPFQRAGNSALPQLGAWLRRPTVWAVMALLAGAIALWLVPEVHVSELVATSPDKVPQPAVLPVPAEVAPPPVAAVEIIPGPRDAVAPASAPVPVAVPTTTTTPTTLAAPTPVAAAAPVKVASAPSNPGTGILVFKAKDATWVEVVDAHKAVLVRRTLAAGETVGYTGELPLSVVVGRIEGVAVEVRGQSFSPEPLAGTNVARFEVK